MCVCCGASRCGWSADPSAQCKWGCRDRDKWILMTTHEEKECSYRKEMCKNGCGEEVCCCWLVVQ